MIPLRLDEIARVVGGEVHGDPGLGMTVYTATPGSPTEESLRLLASWAATAASTTATFTD